MYIYICDYINCIYVDLRSSYLAEKTLVEPLFATHGASLSRSGINIEKDPGISGSQPQWPNGSRKYWDSSQNGFKIPRNCRDQCQSNKSWSLPTSFFVQCRTIVCPIVFENFQGFFQAWAWFFEKKRNLAEGVSNPPGGCTSHLTYYVTWSNISIKIPTIRNVENGEWLFVDLFLRCWKFYKPLGGHPSWMLLWWLAPLATVTAFLELKWVAMACRVPEIVLAYASFRDMPLKAKYIYIYI